MLRAFRGIGTEPTPRRLNLDCAGTGVEVPGFEARQNMRINQARAFLWIGLADRHTLVRGGRDSAERMILPRQARLQESRR